MPPEGCGKNVGIFGMLLFEIVLRYHEHAVPRERRNTSAKIYVRLCPLSHPSAHRFSYLITVRPRAGFAR